MSFNNTVKKEIEQHNMHSIQQPELAQLFLSCGFISDPQKDYRIEFHTATHTPTQKLIGLLSDKGIVAHKVMRGGRMLVYITASEHIEDLLIMMGAQNSALHVMDIKIEKDMHNKANRIANCEIANVDRTAKTNSELLKSVKHLESVGATLPEQLVEAITILKAHPEMSMAEMARELNISKSGLYHRMSRIKAIAEKLQP